MPKNKTWFGRKLYRLLAAQNWTTQEMRMLSDRLKFLMKHKQIQGTPLFKIKSTLRHIALEIDAHLAKKQPAQN